MTENLGEEREVAREDTAHCLYCYHEISSRALRCSSCGTFQNWRRHLQLSGTVLSLLVALVSVSALAVPVILDTWRGERSILSFDVSFNNDEFAYFHFRNIGGAPGLIQSIEFVVSRYKIEFDPDQLGDDTDERLLRPKGGGVVRISSSRVLKNGFRVEMASAEREALMDEMLQWTHHADLEGDFRRVTSGRPWLPYEIPKGGLEADVTTERDSELQDRLRRDVRLGLYRAQRLFRDLDIKDIKAINFDDWYQVRRYEDVLTVLREHWPSIRRNVNAEMVQAYLETNVILQFIDRVFANSGPQFLVRLRNSDGSEFKLRIPVPYREWRNFVRPLLLDGRDASPDWIAFF